MTALETPLALGPEAASGSARVLADELARRDRAVREQRRFLLIARVGVLVAIIVGWDLASGRLIRTFFVSSPGAVARQLADWIASGQLLYHGQFTLTATVLGYVVGSVAAILLAWPLGLMPRLFRITEPYFLVAYSIPAVAMGPIFILWFGLGLTPKILLAAYFVFFIVFVNTVVGFQQVPRGLLDVTRVMGASRSDLLRAVILPSAVPYVLAALRSTLPAAMIGAVVGEFIASNRGLGYLANAAASEYATEGVIAAVFVMALIVLAMTVLLRPLSGALRWQRGIDARGDIV
ncbi:MAG: ABC transporter permease [Chloroflexi bacterium]|nr:ABC transporter permease [Chloroflexota bacterium]